MRQKLHIIRAKGRLKRLLSNFINYTKLINMENKYKQFLIAK